MEVSHLKKGLILVVIVAMFGWAIYSFATKDETVPGEAGQVEDDVIGLEKGNYAPDFELELLTGEKVKLSDYRGKPVLLNFWASWCAPCRAEMPDMQKIHEDYDVAILAVNQIDTETFPENVPEFIEEFGITFPVLMDEESLVGIRYGAMVLPTTYLIDKSGRIYNIAKGPLTYDLMFQAIKAMQ